jgi:SAM-dependent methyltransferase
MNRKLFKLLLAVRSKVIPLINRKESYFLFPTGRTTKPLSTRYGFDRGKPIDRYYIEQYLSENRATIQGKCLEIENNDYTLEYGGNKVTHSDILDINPKNKMANIKGDLRDLKAVKSNTYDTLIITQTISMIDDIQSAIKECHRILKPSGTLLLTVSSTVCPDWYLEDDYWRLTTASARYLFGKHFDKSKLSIKSYGNVLVGQAYWVGMATEELTKKELDVNDPHFPLIIAIKATK